MADSDAATRRRPDGAGLELRGVFGHAILDSEKRRAGRVEDLALEVRHTEDGVPELVLVGIVGGPLSGPMPSWLRALGRAWYRLLGVRDPRTVELPWSEVGMIDAFTHLSAKRDDTGLDQVERGVEQWMRRLPNG